MMPWIQTGNNREDETITSKEGESNQIPKDAPSLEQVDELGSMVYTPRGYDLFLHTPLLEFNGLTGLQLIELGRLDDVSSALASDYEGSGY